jgi:predicted Na+-dependent transporter
MLSTLETILLAGLLLSLMFAVGLSLKPAEFKSVLQHPKAYLLGIFSQFFWMPLLAFALTKTLETSAEMNLALIIIACAPGGSLSNLYSYFSKGKVSLSIALTLSTTVLALFLMPILMGLYINGMEVGTVVVPYKKVLATLFGSLIPVFVGMLVGKLWPTKAANLEKWSSRIGLVFLGLAIVVWVPRMYQQIFKGGLRTYLILSSLSFLGMFAGLLSAKILKLSRAECRTLFFEVGTQNAPLAFTIVGLAFGAEALESYGWLCLLFGAISVGNGFIGVAFFKLWDSRA